MKMKKMLAGLLALALCLGAMAGCSSDAGNESAPAESPSEAITDAVESGEIDGAKVGVLVVSTQSQWCNDLIGRRDRGVRGQRDAGDRFGLPGFCGPGDRRHGEPDQRWLRRHRSQLHERRRAWADLCQQAQDQGIYLIGWSEGYYDAMVVEDEPGRVRHGGGGHRELYRRKGPGSA